nr:unnamed protein product [Callosobruchus analis]
MNNSSPNKLKILQWNAKSAVSNKHSLQKYLDEYSIDVALISETWFKPGRQILFRGYNLVRKDRDDGYAGVAILIKNCYTFSELSIVQGYCNQILMCGIDLLYGNGKLSFYSIYCPPDVRTNMSDWENIFSNIDNTGFIGGDFNAHHSLWGSYKNNPKGSQIVDALNDSNLVLLNTGKPTRFTRNNINSAVDLSLASADIAISCVWDTLDDVMGSDHYPIITEIENKKPYTSEDIHPKTKWILKKANWPVYKDTAFRFFDTATAHNQPVETKYDILVEGINVAASKAIPVNKIIKIGARKILPPWWDEECESAVNNRKDKLRTYKAQSTMANYIKCKEEIARTKKILKEKARKSWQKWCAGLNRNTPVKDMWKQAKKMQGRTCSGSKCSNYEWQCDFFDSIAPPMAHRDFENMFRSNDLNTNNHRIFSEHIDLKELNYAVDGRKNTSPGYDDIRYPMIENLPNNAKELIIDIFNDLWILGKNLEEWKKVIVVPCLKQGKDPNDSNSYIPISLLSCLLKIFERIIKNRLEWWLNHINILPATQYGFKKNYGTCDALLHLVTDIQLCFSDNDYLGALFLDIKGAYDNIDWAILHEKMTDLQIPKEVATTICKLYINRSVTIRQHNGVTNGYRLVSSGLPQGSVLSPLLFNIYTTPIHTTNSNFKIIQYADDFMFYIYAKSYEHCVRSLDLATVPILQCISKLNFNVSPQKSKVVFFSRHRTPRTPEISLSHMLFPVVDEIKYLGMILDKKLTFSQHIENIITKCNKGLNFLKSTMRTWWGADPLIALTFYKSYIRSVVDYGSIIYGNASKRLLKKLDVLQNNAIRISIGAMKSTPIEPLRAEALEPPLDLRREMLADKMVIKSIMKKSPVLNRIALLNERDLTAPYWIKKASPLCCESYRNTSDFKPLHLQVDFSVFLLNTKVIVPQFSEIPNFNNALVKQILTNYADFVTIYTDASKSEAGTGAAFLIPDVIQKQMKLNDHTSIFTAEALAILKSIEFVNNAGIKKCIILSDSLSVLTCLLAGVDMNSHYYHPYIIKIKQLIIKFLEEDKQIIFMWVKAHSGIIFNEKIDQLAKGSIMQGEETSTQLTLHERLNLSRKLFIRKWHNRYEEYCRNKPTRYTSLEPKIRNSYWFENFNYSRKRITTIIRMKFGHACYPAHLHKIKVFNSNQCDICDEIADLDHIFFNCSKYQSQAAKLRERLQQHNVSQPYNILHLLSSNNKKIFDDLLLFVEESKISL